MTPDRATRNLFEAAQSGNTAAAQAALDAGADINAVNDKNHHPSQCAHENGHPDLAKWLYKCERAQFAKHGYGPYEGKDGVIDGEVIGVLLGLILVGFLAWMPSEDTPNNSKTAPNNNKPTPNKVDAQTRLRSVLKDPTKTGQLITKLESESMTQEFLDDPEVMKNLRRLTAAVENHVQESLDERVQQLRKKRHLLDDTNPGNWSEKAVQSKGGQSPKRD